MSDYVATIDLNGRVGKVILPSDATENELKLMKDFLGKTIDMRIEKAKELRVMNNPKLADIGDFDISVRLYQVLRRGGCNTVEDVLSHSKSELMAFRNMGRHSLEECERVFGKFGSFKPEIIGEVNDDKGLYINEGYQE